MAYELLFRGARSAVTATQSDAYATTQVILTAFQEFGLDQIVGDKRCLLNMTREFLVGDLPLPFEPERVVLEVLETVEIDEEVIAGVAALAARGFKIALDDFVWGSGHERLLGLASYVKLDVLGVPIAEVEAALHDVRRYPHIEVLAERIETQEQLDALMDLGFDYFQGHVYARPQTLTAVSVNPSRLRRLELFTALSAADTDIDEVVPIVTADPALSFRVLQATNSAAVGLARKVSSVREAATVLGANRIRQWVVLLMASDVAEASPEQLAGTLTRARLCQLVARHAGAPTDAAFTVGLLSGVADLVAEPIEELVPRLPVTPEIAAALTGGSGRLGAVLQLVRAYESSDLPALAVSPMSATELARAYLSAVGWSESALAGLAR
ncbi:EAL and HDOD domain-containing protein [Virgisporangium aurantiacum]|uniref:Histidine kinase n=1 Tax=Virgisporangium aurantiacum TaxID=175570 RepID=A0A8J3YXK0_9ACTN|nr:HDOD domain-containing protein [Virgisporangium aurantiacum]GIJ52532.1 histidine kinase [Virgisporangium aurantiacum]